MNGDDRGSFGLARWLAVLAGIYPFLFFGPLMILLAYPYPYPAWRTGPGFQALIAALSVLPVAIGFSVGWLKRFPLWSYPYTCLTAVFTGLGFSTLLNGQVNWAEEGSFLMIMLLAVGLAALLIYLTRHDLPLIDLFEDIRRDWTRLSLGLMILPAALFAMPDHDEDPVLTIFVIGPTLVLLVTALLALLARSKHSRAPVLAGGMLLMILVRLGSGKWFFLLYWLLMVAVVFAPYVLQQPRPAKKVSQKV